MTLMALYLRLGKTRCAVGVVVALTANTKVTVDDMRQEMVTPAQITEDLPRPFKVTATG